MFDIGRLRRLWCCVTFTLSSLGGQLFACGGRDGDSYHSAPGIDRLASCLLQSLSLRVYAFCRNVAQGL